MMDSIWTNLFLAWGIQSASLLSPGPSVLFLLSVASARGRSHALAASVGISGAAVIWSTGTVMGLSTILAEAGYALSIMKVVGACYLFWLALKSFRSALSSDALVVKSKHVTGGLFKSVGIGFAMQISNPKAIFFWLAIASLGATAEGPTWVPFIFVLVAVCLSLFIHMAWAFAFSTAAAVSAYARAQHWIDAILGALFTAAAVRLATSDV